jgi:hypothetical protein
MRLLLLVHVLVLDVIDETKKKQKRTKMMKKMITLSNIHFLETDKIFVPLFEIVYDD